MSGRNGAAGAVQNIRIALAACFETSAVLEVDSASVELQDPCIALDEKWDYAGQAFDRASGETGLCNQSP